MVQLRQMNALVDMLADVKYALRRFNKSPGFTATAVVTLALGIGATAAIFTLIQQVMLRSLAVAKPEQLWRIGDAVTCCYSTGYTQSNHAAENDWTLFSWEAYQRFRADTAAFEQLAAFQVGTGNGYVAVRRAGSREAVQSRLGEFVSGNFFQTFGISAWRGRLFTDADDVRGALPVAVISFHTWQEKYGSDPSVIGAPYDINGRAFSIIGVAPPGFFGAKVAASDMPDMWLPLTTEPLIAGATSRLENPGLAWLDLIGRVRPGTNPRTLEAQLQGELRQWLASHRLDMSAHDRARWNEQTLHLTPGGAGVSLMREQYQDGLRLLLIAAICVLLLACANIANLLLARNLRHARQTAMRAAIGASPARLVREALIDSAVLAGVGGAAGIAVAWAGARLIVHLAFQDALGPGERRALDAGVAVRACRVADDGAALRHRAGVDHVARRPDGRHAWIDPHGFRDDRRAESARDRASGRLGCAAERGRDAGPEPVQSGASEPRLRGRRPLPGVDRLEAIQPAARAIAPALPRD